MNKQNWPYTNVVDPEIYKGRTDWPKISIVTPSYNQGQYIEETILSILNQNYPNLEYIIIDGGSTDHTVEIIKKYEDRITYWVSEPDKGQADAINKGLERCTGEIFNWINSDDYLEEKSLFHISESFIYEKYDCYAGRVTNFSKTTKILIQNSLLTLDNFLSTTPQKKYSWHQPGVWFSLTKVNQLLKINIELHYSFDFELMLRILKDNNKIQYSSSNLVYFRLHDESKSVSLANEFIKEFYKIRYNYIKQNYGYGLKLFKLNLYYKKYNWYNEIEAYDAKSEKYRFLFFLIKKIIGNPIVRLNRLSLSRLYKVITS